MSDWWKAFGFLAVIVLVVGVVVSVDYLRTCREDACVVWVCGWQGNGRC